jgi:N-dimethylarginine dimethylaminohydrolase
LRKEGGEEELYGNWFKDNGYNVSRIPSEFKFEGRGDAFVYGDYLVGSYGIRSDKDALLYIADKFALEPVIVELAQDKFYHLDTCFQNLPSGDAIFYPDAFIDKSLSTFESLFNLIPVTEDDANKLACNAVVVNNTVIFPSEDIEAIRTIEKLGLQAEAADVSEFLKSGGACQCLVIALN